MSPSHMSEFSRAMQLPSSSSKLLLQFVAVRLRVWVSDESGIVHRPVYIFCLELYPRGRVINQRLHTPIGTHPTAADYLDFLISHIVSPPADTERHRPTHVAFVDDNVTKKLRSSLAKLRVEVSTLSMADGVLDYVSKFSTHLVEKGKATRGDAAERAGMLTVSGITVDKVAKMCQSAVKMYSRRPWQRVPEHIALKVRMPSEEGRNGYREQFYVTILGSDKKAFGFAMMASLNELRGKYRRAILGGSNEEEGGGLLAGDIMVCAACGKRVGETTLDNGQRYVDRCGGCKRVLYCDEVCQRLDWKLRHRFECARAREDPEFVFKRDEWAWLRRELALLFVDPTSVPFDDLDGFEDHDWKLINNDDGQLSLYPMPFVTVQGIGGMTVARVQRPTEKELRFVTLIANAMSESNRPPPPDGVLHLASGVSIEYAENLADCIKASI